MSKHTADAIVIGAGIIGTSTALHLARAGRKVIVVDKLPGAGQGSTSYSSGICRMFYSVLDSVKFSWEGYHYFSNWEEFIQVKDDRGHAQLRECGGLALRSPSTDAWIQKMEPLFQQVGIPYETWDLATLQARFGAESPFRMDFSSFAPPKRIDDPAFGETTANAEATGALWVDRSGYVSDPTLAVLNLQLAAEQTNNAEHSGAHEHLKNAAAEIRVGKWSNSIRESIHSVESVASKMSKKGTLGKALDEIDRTRTIHPAMKSAFKQLYGYTSDEEGIRHALIENNRSSSEQEALFMLSACAAFVSYLINSWEI